MTGTVYLVGAGPGAPDLITLRAARLLAVADIVFHDALVHPDTMALARRAVHVPVGKRNGRLSSAQHFINKRLVDAARCHAIVVRLKGGDPLLFGRAQEEIDALRTAGIAFEIVPGVTAAFAASAEVATSLTRRADATHPASRSVVFVTPSLARDADPATADQWIAAALAADTAVLYMASREADRVARALIDGGKRGGTPVVVVESASLAGVSAERTTLGFLASRGLARREGPATLIVGDAMRDAEAIDLGIDAMHRERCRAA